MFKISFLILALLLASSCGKRSATDDSNTSHNSCTTQADTSINAVENVKYVTLDYPGDWKSQIHLETVGSYGGFYRYEWDVKKNRQTCSTGNIGSGGSYEYYLQITYKSNAWGMTVVSGKNYIDYVVYGCTSSATSSCTTPIEVGTLVIVVNYIPH